MTGSHPAARSVVSSARDVFAMQRRLAEGAIAQLTDEQLHRVPGPDANSVAVLIQHLAGNLRSRFTDFLTSDGEKPWRHRDEEFVDTGLDRASLLAAWGDGWGALLAALDGLSDADLGVRVTIRQEPHTVAQALHRSLGHTAYHVGQIVQRARGLVGPAWKTLSIARGTSAEFNRRKGHGK